MDHIAIGHLDQLVNNRLTGWVWSPIIPAAKLAVYIFVNKVLVGKALARDLRPDLLKAGIGDGRYGFAFVFEKGNRLNKDDIVEATTLQNNSYVNLIGSPINVDDTNVIDGQYAVRDDGLVHGWIVYETGDSAPDLELEVNGKLAASFRIDQSKPVETCHDGSIKASFECLIPKELVGHSTVSIRVLRGNTSSALQPNLTEFSYYGSYFEHQDEAENSRLGVRSMILEQLLKKPYISVLLPTYNSNIEFLNLAIESVLSQSYFNWQLCIADDNSTKSDVRKLIRHHIAKDPRICAVFRSENGNISEASNSALSIANGSFVALLDHDDLLDEDALLHIAHTINTHPTASLIFTDEDKCNSVGQRYDPYHKLGWNPELMLGQNCVSHLGVFRTTLIRASGGFRSEYDGAQDYELVLRISDNISADQIVHVPRVLYHWRAVSGSTALSGNEKRYASIARRRAVRHHLRERNLQGSLISDKITHHLRFKPALDKQAASVSVIIHHQGSLKNLSILLQSIRKSMTLTTEVLVVSSRSAKSRSRLVKSLGPMRIHWNTLPADSSAGEAFVQSINQVSGAVLIWIDSRVIPCKKCPGWLNELVRQALRSESGFVGAKITDPSGKIESFGYDRRAGKGLTEQFKGVQADEYGLAGIAQLTRNVTAVSSHVFSIKLSLLRAILESHAAPVHSESWIASLCEHSLKLGAKNLVTPSCLFSTVRG